MNGRRRPKARQARGAKARRDGRSAELVAALWLFAKGWRILGVRLATPLGEIDLLARKGRVLAVVEVKRRAVLAEALAAVRPGQRARLRAAATALAGRRADLRDLAIRLDLVALGARGLPRHCPDAWPDDLGASSWRGR